MHEMTQSLRVKKFRVSCANRQLKSDISLQPRLKFKFEKLDKKLSKYRKNVYFILNAHFLSECPSKFKAALELRCLKTDFFGCCAAQLLILL